MIIRALDRLEEWLIAGLIAAATLIIFFAVGHRYGTGLAIDIAKWATSHGLSGTAAIFNSIFEWLASLQVSWAQELCIYMFIWMAKFGAAYGVRTGIHVGVDVLVNMLPAGSRKRVILFAILCGAFFTAVVALFGVAFVSQMYATDQVSADLELPMWIVYLAIPLGSGLMCFRFLQVAWWFYWTDRLPHHDETHVEGVETDASAALHPKPVEAGEARGFSPLGIVLILLPILIVAVCIGDKAGVIALPPAPKAVEARAK